MTKSFEYVAFVYDQRSTEGAPKFCIFHASVSEILQWAAIQRLSKNDPAAVQRDPKRTRILGIKRFFEREVRNTIPTAVVLTLDNITMQLLSPDASALESHSVAVVSAGMQILKIEVPENVDEADKPGLVM